MMSGRGLSGTTGRAGTVSRFLPAAVQAAPPMGAVRGEGV